MSGRRPISEVCRHYGITPTQHYDWQRRFFEGAVAALETRPKRGKVDKGVIALSRALSRRALAVVNRFSA